jgi:cation:H+ antiporter
MVWESLLFLFAGLAIVVYGADEAIKRLLNLSRFFRLSIFAAGILIAGTLAVLPEMSIGVISAIEGTSSFGFGIILGSNVADLTLVIGVVILFAGKLNLNPTVLKQLRISFLAVILPVLLLLDGELSNIDGVFLLGAFVVYSVWLVTRGRDGGEVVQRRGFIRFAIEVALLVVGVTVLFIGSSLVTDQAQALSESLGLPLFLIGVIVAVGTCLPELAFSVRACETKSCDLGLGNILGNVLADSMLTIGIIALIQPIKPTNLFFPLSTGVFMVFSVLLLYWRSKDGVLDKRDAAVLILVYGIFLALQSLLEALGV